MPQNLESAREESAYVLDLIGRKTLTPPEQSRVVEEAVRYWTDYVNPGFLEYRKSVSTDYTAVEWQDEGAVFRDVGGKTHDIVVLGHNIAQVQAQMEAYGLPGAVQH